MFYGGKPGQRGERTWLFHEKTISVAAEKKEKNKYNVVLFRLKGFWGYGIFK